MPDFLIFVALTLAGVESATAAHITAPSIPGQSDTHSRYISSAETTSTRRTPGGVSKATGPLTSTTSAPRAASCAATAYPILPVEWLEMNLTGSIASTVGPAVTKYRPRKVVIRIVLNGGAEALELRNCGDPHLPSPPFSSTSV
jgi:hypothetical protein